MAAVAIHIISRTGRNHWRIEQWLRMNGLRADWIISKYSVSDGRNDSVVEFLKGGDGFLLQLDDDVIPDEDTNPIMDVSDNKALVFCGYPPCKRTDGPLTCVMPGCMRIRRDVLESMPWPWFEPVRGQQGKRLKGEEHMVVARATEMGHIPEQVGMAGHLMEMVAKYKNGKIAFSWPHEMSK